MIVYEIFERYINGNALATNNPLAVDSIELFASEEALKKKHSGVPYDNPLALGIFYRKRIVQDDIIEVTESQSE